MTNDPGGAPDGRLAFSPSVAASLRDSDLRIVVTGAGGWLGSATLEMLDSALGAAVASRVSAFGTNRRMMRLRSGRSVAVAALDDLTGSGSHRAAPSLLAHYAFVTREHVADRSLSAYVAANQAISDTVAAWAARNPAQGIFVPSSGAVYRDGRLDDDLEANPYGAMKLADEWRFRRMAESRQEPRLVVARLFNLAGPFLNKPELYALGSVITDVLAHRAIAIRATRPVIRSYVHVADLIELAFAIMVGQVPTSPEPFDTAGEREIEIGDLARLAATVLGQPGLAVERPKLCTDSPDRYVGDGTALAQMAVVHGMVPRPLSVQIADTAAYLSNRLT